MLSSGINSTLVDSAEGPLLVAGAIDQQAARNTTAHRHARGQLFGSSRGLLVVGTDGGQWVVPSSHAVWIPPHQAHGLQTFGPFAGWSAYVAERMCSGLPQTPFPFRLSGLLREAIRRAVQWGGGPLTDAQARIVEVVLDEVRASPHEPLGLPMPRDERVQSVARALLADPANPRSLNDWPELAGLAPRSVARHFLAETGFTFAEWRQRARLLKALQMLSSGHAVGNVALDLGYDNVSAFIAMFRRAMGTTPGRFAAGSEFDRVGAPIRPAPGMA